MEKENLDILKTIEQEMDTDVHPLLKMILTVQIGRASCRERV